MKLEDVIKTSRFADERHKATINVIYSAYWLRNKFSAELKKEDLTMEQYNVIRILKGKHPEQMCVKDIGSRMLEKSSNVPRIIDKLVIKKLVKRVPSKVDKRETLISLTERGLNVLERASDLIEESTSSIALNLPDAQQLNDLLEQMRNS